MYCSTNSIQPLIFYYYKQLSNIHSLLLQRNIMYVYGQFLTVHAILHPSWLAKPTSWGACPWITCVYIYFYHASVELANQIADSQVDKLFICLLVTMLVSRARLCLLIRLGWMGGTFGSSICYALSAHHKERHFSIIIFVYVAAIAGMLAARGQTNPIVQQSMAIMCVGYKFVSSITSSLQSGWSQHSISWAFIA